MAVTTCWRPAAATLDSRHCLVAAALEEAGTCTWAALRVTGKSEERHSQRAAVLSERSDPPCWIAKSGMARANMARN